MLKNAVLHGRNTAHSASATTCTARNGKVLRDSGMRSTLLYLPLAVRIAFTPFCANKSMALRT